MKNWVRRRNLGERGGDELFVEILSKNFRKFSNFENFQPAVQQVSVVTQIRDHFENVLCSLKSDGLVWFCSFLRKRNHISEISIN